MVPSCMKGSAKSGYIDNVLAYPRLLSRNPRRCIIRRPFQLSSLLNLPAASGIGDSEGTLQSLSNDLSDLKSEIQVPSTPTSSSNTCSAEVNADDSEARVVAGNLAHQPIRSINRRLNNRGFNHEGQSDRKLI